MRDKDIHRLIEEQNPVEKDLLYLKLKATLGINMPTLKQSGALELLVHLLVLKHPHPGEIFDYAIKLVPEYTKELQQIAKDVDVQIVKS